jgi:amidophosphoribosyltransferase
LGKLNGAFVVASETVAFDIIGAEYICDVEPGEILVIDDEAIASGSVKSYHLAKRAVSSHHCIFEYIYFSRPDSKVFGENVDKVRRRLGRRLAIESPADADMVIAVPDSSNTIALGFTEESKIPFELGLIRNHYVGRTFIQPRQAVRDGDVRIKFNPVRGVLKGKRIVLVDDSIVRGSTMKKLITMLREAGADKIHLRIGSPPITHSCYYGIDTPTRGELIASSHSVRQIEEYLGVDSLHYLSTEGLLSCVEDPDNYCVACFTGAYPVMPDGCLHKDVFEDRTGCDGGFGVREDVDR